MPDSSNPREREARTPAQVVVCADDYGRDAASSAVIRTLIGAGAVNATTCLVEAKTWREQAGPLRTLTDANAAVGVGLHLNLTERLANVSDPALLAPVAMHVARSALPVSAEREAAVLQAFRAQWTTFVEAFGRAPDFIDGHEHVHLFPAHRRALLRLASEVGFGGWLRQCETSSARLGLKRQVLDPLSRAFRREALAGGWVVNPGFGGLRRFQPGEDMAALWRTDLAAMREGGVLMVHPGAVSNDPPGRCREQEARLIGAGALAEGLPDLGLALANDRARPWT